MLAVRLFSILSRKVNLGLSVLSRSSTTQGLWVLNICHMVGFAGHYRYYDQARTIRIPVHMVETINKLYRKILGRDPPEEIGAEMVCSWIASARFRRLAVSFR